MADWLKWGRHRSVSARASTWPLALLFLGPSGCEGEGGERESNEAALATTPVTAAWTNRHQSGTGFPCDVDEVLAQSCRRCHWEPTENDAPFSMAKFDDVQEERSGMKVHQLMEQMVAADLMPPLDALVEPEVRPLTAAQKSTLLRWLRAGAPRSSASCEK